mmetsp:Transcript_35950/g.73907  ORF Transcript_35950/g.73907 Transcript_35950/m.73907 type:complete len:184 (-) Transcript_35950:11-562(-)
MSSEPSKEAKEMADKKLALEKELKLDLAPKFVEKGTQATYIPRIGKQDQAHYGGRATFRPPSADTGRPSYRPDPEDQLSDFRSLKKELADTKKEVDKLKAQVARSEAKDKEKDRLVEQVLTEKSHVLPSRIADLIQKCVSSAQNSKLQEAEETIGNQESIIEQLTSEVERIQRTGSGVAAGVR